jgi:hypothetical protein
MNPRLNPMSHLFDSLLFSVAGIKLISKNIITPNPPITRLAYPSSLFFAISDIPPNPTPIIRSIVTELVCSLIQKCRYIITIFDITR